MNAVNKTKQVMLKQAWAGARKAAEKHGGKASDYIAECMKTVWTQAKRNVALKVESIKVSITEFRSEIKAGIVHVQSIGNGCSSNVVTLTGFEWSKAFYMGLIG
jgi:hypothetical protein